MYRSGLWYCLCYSEDFSNERSLYSRACRVWANSEGLLRFFVTGCAGFIGSNLTDRLLAANHQVVG